MIDDGVCAYTELLRTDHEASASDLVRRAPLEVLALPDGQVVCERASLSEFVSTSRERVHEMFAEAGFVGEPVGESFLGLQRA